MRTTLFILVVVAIGVFYGVLFGRMKLRWGERHPGDKRNPITWWLRGRYDDDDDEDQGR